MSFNLKIGFLLALGLGVLALHLRYPWVLEDPDNIAGLIFLVLLLSALIVSGGGRRRPQGVMNAISHLLIWGVLIVGVALAYDNRDALQRIAAHGLSAFQPGAAVSVAPGAALLSRGSDGHFTAIAEVQGRRVPMLVDTGATLVSLPFEDAKRAGVDVGRLEFVQEVMTANGVAFAAPIILDEVAIGDIRLRNVRASVAQPGRLSTALLGMSFLSRLSAYSFEGDRLILRE